MLLQGFPPNTLDGCHDALKVQASGNAYPVPLMMAVLVPIVKDIKEDLLQPFPAEPLNSPRCVALCHDFECYMDKFASQVQDSGKPQKMKRPAAAKSKANKDKKAKTMKKAVAKSEKKAVKKTQAKQKKTPKKAVKKQSKRVRPAYRWLSSSES